VTIGFRPESLDVVSDGTGLPIVVDLVEELGSDAYIYGHADIAGDDTRIVARTEGRRVPTLGDTVNLSINKDEVHAFHATTGNRLD
jgi:multiple sugar transport system ATP-binding protein